MWPIIHSCEKRTIDILHKYEGQKPDALTQKALDQLVREKVLLESSDWPFLVTTGQAKDYATERFEEHVERFNQVADMLESGKIDEPKLAAIADIDIIFAEIDTANFVLAEKLPAEAAASHHITQLN